MMIYYISLSLYSLLYSSGTCHVNPYVCTSILNHVSPSSTKLLYQNATSRLVHVVIVVVDFLRVSSLVNIC